MKTGICEIRVEGSREKGWGLVMDLMMAKLLKHSGDIKTHVLFPLGSGVGGFSDPRNLVTMGHQILTCHNHHYLNQGVLAYSM